MTRSRNRFTLCELENHNHSWADPVPDVVALVSDALVLFPWDRQVYTAGRWQMHPELAQAITMQEKGNPIR